AGSPGRDQAWRLPFAHIAASDVAAAVDLLDRNPVRCTPKQGVSLAAVERLLLPEQRLIGEAGHVVVEGCDRDVGMPFQKSPFQRYGFADRDRDLDSLNGQRYASEGIADP